MSESPPRSYLYVPGNAPEKLDKAVARGADALIIDLEDAVPPSAKDATRSDIAAWLAARTPHPEVQFWVRTNPGQAGMLDIAALAGIESLTGLVLAKVIDVADVVAGAAALERHGDSMTSLMPMIETAAAMLRVEQIATGPRVAQLQIGEVDLAADLGISVGPDESELLALRTAVVVASTAAGIAQPLGPVSRVTADDALLEESSQRVRRLGFFGRACIHPAQIDVVHRVFTPTSSEVAEAEALLESFERSIAAGEGVFVDERGLLVDEAVVRTARRRVATSRQWPTS